MKTLRYPMILFCIVILSGLGNAVVIENQHQPVPNQVVEFRSISEVGINPVFYPMRQDFVDSFERSTITPWTTEGDTIWGIRDTLNTYGPQSCAVSGYQYAGHPELDVPEYYSPGANPGLLTRLVSPAIDITGWDSLFLSFNYWGDFEGASTNFDGGIIEISTNSGATWVQIDSLAEGHLNPTYDSPLANTGQLGTAWAYCYTTNPNWVSICSQDLVGLNYAAAGDQIKIRFTFAYDALSGGQGWYIDDVRIADTSPPDLQPPTIVHTPLSDTTDTLSDYTISATVTDEGSGVDTDSVYLHYQIESGPVVDIQMADMGSDVYEADIPAQVYHTDIYYSISAADLVGNEGSTPTYNFEVTNARTIIYDDGQPNFAPLVTSPGDGCFAQFIFSEVGIDSGLLHQVKFLFEGPGPFDVRVYEGTAGLPGAFIDSMAGLTSPGYQWYTVDITYLDIKTNNPFGVVVGYIIGPGPDSLGLLRDSTLDYPDRMWNYVSSVWQGESGGDHMIRLKVIPITFTGVSETPTDASVFTLSQIAPNPMRDNAVIEYQLATGQKVCFNVYDVLGQLVKKLVDHYEPAGSHRVIWDSRDERGNSVASGIYFLQCKIGNSSTTQKLLLLK